jgi:hypothetical protein
MDRIKAPFVKSSRIMFEFLKIWKIFKEAANETTVQFKKQYFKAPMTDSNKS